MQYKLMIAFACNAESFAVAFLVFVFVFFFVCFFGRTGKMILSMFFISLPKTRVTTVRPPFSWTHWQMFCLRSVYCYSRREWPVLVYHECRV